MAPPLIWMDVSGAMPPQAGPAWRGNEPAGLTQITSRAFNSTTDTYTSGEDGWWDFGGSTNAFDNAVSNLTIGSDAAAPQSPSNIGRFHFEVGYDGGFSPASCESPGVFKDLMYMCAWIKYSSNWQGHPSLVNKQFHYWIDPGGNKLVISAFGIDSDPLYPTVTYQGIVSGGNTGGGTSAAWSGSTPYVRGQWHLLEVSATGNTSGNADGTVKLWFDGVLQVDQTGIEIVSGGTGWSHLQISPIWGGTGQNMIAAQDFYIDHIYVSGV